MLAGEAAAGLASELHISHVTLHRWKMQALIDHDLLPEVKSFDDDELAKVERTIIDLEDERELVKATAAISNGAVARLSKVCRSIQFSEDSVGSAAAVVA